MADGVLVIDKPAGLTSHDVVYRVRRLFHSKVGHTGTLDPLATGVLVLLLGRATRLARFLRSDEKDYLAEIKLGTTTDTYDREGRVVSEKPVPPLDEAEVRAVLAGFVGSIKQVPPAYSAIKVGGRKLYERARRQEEVKPPERQIRIHRLELLGYEQETISVAVGCSAGTYIRSLAHDIGAVIGCGAHLWDLRRTRAGSFDLTRAVPLSALPNWGSQMIIPVGELLPEVPRLDLAEATAERVRHGNAFPFAAIPGLFRLFEGDRLIAIAEGDGNVIQPVVVLEADS